MAKSNRPTKSTPASKKSAAPAVSASPPDQLLDMDAAIALLRTTRPTFYRWLRAGKLKGMKVGRQWRFYRSDIDRFLQGQGPRIDLPTDIGPLIRDLQARLKDYSATPLPDAGADQVQHAVRLTIQLAAVMNASDLHLALQSDAAHLRVRLDGVLHPLLSYDARLHPALIAAWKSLAACDLNETELPQDGRILLPLPGLPEPLDVRNTFVPALGGEALTARLLRRGHYNFSLDHLGFAPRDQEKVRRALAASHGLLLFTGPTGCGKTTVIYSCLTHLIHPGVKVLSIEDPVEVALDGVVQIAVQEWKSQLTFPAAIRAALRSDPDVMMVGEIRNLDTAQLCLQVALTGHLVLTTLHTEDAPAALVRLTELGLAPFVLADAAKLIVAQRLVRRLCPECRRPGTPDAALLAEAERLARAGGLDWSALPKSWKEPVGCKLCRSTGYRGRAMIAEVLEITPELAQAVRRSATARELRTLALGQGFTTMAAHGLLRAAAGETSLAEVLAVAPKP